jgi:hypothetical protein
MIYKLVNYQGKLDSIQLIKDNGEFWSIPINEANTDYQEYLQWVAEGNTPEPADEV